MSFFDKLLGTESAHSTLPETEFHLDPQSVEAILAELDLESAISAHETWKVRLQACLDGHSSEMMDPEVVCLDDQCQLGTWLYGPGGQRLSGYPAFRALVARHQQFHQLAATVLTLAQAGHHAKAQDMLHGSYRNASNQVVELLQDLQRGLGR
jgi:hypothetical protein